MSEATAVGIKQAVCHLKPAAVALVAEWTARPWRFERYVFGTTDDSNERQLYLISFPSFNKGWKQWDGVEQAIHLTPDGVLHVFCAFGDHKDHQMCADTMWKPIEIAAELDG